MNTRPKKVCFSSNQIRLKRSLLYIYIRFHNRSLGSIIDPLIKLALKRQDDLIIYMKSNLFFLLNSHDRISISVTKYTEKQKHFSCSVFHTYTEINGIFSILSSKVNHFGTFVIKPIVFILN